MRRRNVLKGLSAVGMSSLSGCQNLPNIGKYIKNSKNGSSYLFGRGRKTYMNAPKPKIKDYPVVLSRGGGNPVYLEPSNRGVANGTILTFNFINNSSGSVTYDPCFWKLSKLENGNWTPIAPETRATSKRSLKPQSKEKIALEIGDVKSSPDSPNVKENIVPCGMHSVSELERGVYAFSIVGEPENEQSPVTYSAIFEITNDGLAWGARLAYISIDPGSLPDSLPLSADARVLRSGISPAKTARIEIEYTNTSEEDTVDITTKGFKVYSTLYSKNRKMLLLPPKLHEKSYKETKGCWTPKEKNFELPSKSRTVSLDPGESFTTQRYIWFNSKTHCYDSGNYRFRNKFTVNEEKTGLWQLNIAIS